MKKSPAADRRGFSRIPFTAEVAIQAGTAEIRAVTNISVSMSGLRIPYQGPLPEAGTACRATIVLQAFDHRLPIEASGRILKSEPGSVAVEFLELDLDSYNHLRQLILNNTDEPEKAEREFLSHWGIRRPV